MDDLFFQHSLNILGLKMPLSWGFWPESYPWIQRYFPGAARGKPRIIIFFFFFVSAFSFLLPEGVAGEAVFWLGPTGSFIWDSMPERSCFHLWKCWGGPLRDYMPLLQCQVGSGMVKALGAKTADLSTCLCPCALLHASPSVAHSHTQDVGLLLWNVLFQEGSFRDSKSLLSTLPYRVTWLKMLWLNRA